MKVLNLQLDSADPAFIFSHLDALPFIREKVKRGTSGVLQTYPSSPRSWTSFWTAQPPWVHGITGFWKPHRRLSPFAQKLHRLVNSPEDLMRPSGSATKDMMKRLLPKLRWLVLPAARAALRASYQTGAEPMRPYNRSDVQWVTGYEIMERAGLRVGLVNSLYSYPAWPISGYLVSDWTMPLDARDYYHPPELASYLEDIGYKATLDGLKQKWGWLEGNIGDDAEAIYEASLRELEVTKLATLHLMKNYDWDFHATMFRFLDTVHHLFADREDRLLTAYRLVDETLCDISREAVPPETEVCWLINSDHGAYVQWSEGVIRGGHDPSGFYCFAYDGWFAAGRTRTLRIEALMPHVLQVLGIDPWTDLKGELVEGLVLDDADQSAVEERLRALGYL